MFKVHLKIIDTKPAYLIFQNISCLRFINMLLGYNYTLQEFQNISCLRFINRQIIQHAKDYLFQNISCLRFI